VKVVADVKANPLVRDRCTSAIIERIRVEQEGERTDRKVLESVKKQIAQTLLRLILADDRSSQTCVNRILTTFVPNNGINTTPGQKSAERKKAYAAWKRRLD
jgi:hypothetical protein